MNVPESQSQEVKIHEINIKGYMTQAFKDSQTEKRFNDVVYGYGKLLFTGTEEELDNYLAYLVKNEGKFGFKII